MPLGSAEKTAYRTLDQMGKCYVWVIKPIPIWSGDVNGTPDQGATSIPYNGATLLAGYTADVHYTLKVQNSALTETKAYIRYKSGASAAASGTLTVDKNNVEWADDDRLTIYAEIRPWAVTPNVANTMEDEDKVYIDENENMHPLTLIGPPAVAFLDGAYVDVKWWSSAELSHCGGSISATTWTYKNGTKQSGTGTELDPEIIRYTTAGSHLVKCKKDHSNGSDHTRYSYTIICNRSGSNSPYSNVDVRISGDLDGYGGQATVTVKEGGDQDDFIDNSMVVIFTETWFGGTKVNYGGNWTHRENVVFVGWIEEDSVNIEPETGHVTFEVVHPSKMDLACWPANLFDDSGEAADWHRILNMQAEQAFFHLISEHSTIDHCCDVNLPTTTLALQYVDISEADLWTQLMDQIGITIGAVMAFDRQGALHIEQNVQLIPEASRSGVDVMFALATTDWQSLTLDKEQGKQQVAQSDFVSFYYSGADPTPWYSLAPARQHPFGTIDRTRGVRADSQADANALAGLYLAMKNAEFQNNRVLMAGQWLCFDVMPQRYFTLSLAGTESFNYRGLVWSGQAAKMLPRSYDLTYSERGYWQIEVGFAQDSLGPPGGDGDYGDPIEPGEPPAINSPLPIPEKDPTWPTVGFLATRSHGVFISTNFTGPGGAMPTWSQINGGLPGLDVQFFAINEGLTGYKQQALKSADDSQIYIRDTDVSNDWSLSLTTTRVRGDLNASASIRSLGRGAKDGTLWVYVYCSTVVPSGGNDYRHFVYYSTDWGDNWNGPGFIYDGYDHIHDRTLEGTGMISGYGTNCWISNRYYLYRSMLAWGPGGGGTYYFSTALWGTAWVPPLFIPPPGSNKAYGNKSGAYISEFDKNLGNDNLTQLETDGLWGWGIDPEDERWNSMWGSWTDPLYMRCFTTFGGTQRFAETEDNWSSYSFGINFIYNATLRPWGLRGTITTVAPVVAIGNEDWIAMASADLGIAADEMPQAVWVMADKDSQPQAKAGPNPGTPPYTDSIPYTITTIARNGLQFVRGS